ncbi:beta-ketoacyl-ACP synthase II [Campylobacter sp. MIT 19-121]|uniref:beta-ketoacyl-ACP synthase II n=1 Tax=Campylobacter sp. MIT 19-121 TaxID=2703906 RepID=UPI001389A5BF|nr:beta-ketoacyl-ACP synthase II [Campylobacter sp. MIT 19-121]NDJ26562.1 beta-ketoacyl-ACP synthase II [Campylobacter sp. MIT 19-121]
MARVVVTGIGMINALGLDKESSFKAICEGKSGVDKITLFDASEFPVQIAAEVKGFDPLKVIDPKEVKKLDRFIQLGIKAAKEAMSDANFDENLDKESFGVVSGAGIGGLPNIEKNSVTCFERGARKISPFFVPSALVNMLGGVISIEHGLKGPNIACVTACAASTHAIAEAYKSIALGDAEKMLVIGAEATICPVGIGGFAAMKALSTRNDDPQHASRPFDKERDGFVMGEGAAALVFEEYEAAKKRGARIYAELVGYGESGDAHHITSPSLDGPLRAMQKALKMAGGIKIDYINAHGTSTPANDKNETAAIKELFGANIPLISSTKGQLGHCLGAAGALEAVISLMALNAGIVPPTINQLVKDEDCDLDYVPNVAKKAELKAVMSNSFGFGGTNGSVIFKKLD